MLIGELTAFFIQLGFEEFASGHEQSRVQEWTSAADVSGSVEFGVEEVDERVETDEDHVEDVLRRLVVHQSAFDRVV